MRGKWMLGVGMLTSLAGSKQRRRGAYLPHVAVAVVVVEVEDEEEELGSGGAARLLAAPKEPLVARASGLAVRPDDVVAQKVDLSRYKAPDG